MDLPFAPFAPLAAPAEWEKVNLNPPAEVLFGRFSLSSLSLAEGQTFSHLSISCTAWRTIHITASFLCKSHCFRFKFSLNQQLTHPQANTPAFTEWHRRCGRGNAARSAHTSTSSLASEYHLSNLTHYFNPKLGCKTC